MLDLDLSPVGVSSSIVNVSKVQGVSNHHDSPAPRATGFRMAQPTEPHGLLRVRGHGQWAALDGVGPIGDGPDSEASSMCGSRGGSILGNELCGVGSDRDCVATRGRFGLTQR